VLQALREDRGVWDLAELSDLPEDSVGLRVLGGEARTTRCAVGVSAGEWCPYLPLAPTREEYFDSLGRSKRSRLKRAKKAVEGIGCSYALADRPETLGPALEALFVLHAKRWAARGLPGNLHDAAVRAFHHRLASTLGSQGTMRIYTLEREGKAVACDYVLQRGKTVYFYQTAFDPDPAWEEYKPGYTLLAHTIEDSVDRGAREFDFLRGREEYKERWTSCVRETWRLTVVPQEHLPALARYRGGQAFRWMKRRIKALFSRGKR
jgi:CelD/BcsL family acetyltransferase involved in cellulose biosynthesis